jgi:ABC-type transport system substrate-binding protein
VEWAAFQSKHTKGDFDAFVASRIASTRVNLDSWTTDSPRNNPGYANAALDRLNERALAATSIEEARPLWLEAQRAIAEDQPVTFLFEQDRLYAVRRGIDGIEESPLGIFEGLRRWSPPPAARASRGRSARP